MTTRYTWCQSILLVGLMAFAVIATTAHAQQPGNASEFSFGPPLRSDNVFTYKYTERVGSFLRIDGQPFDSSERVLTYFMSMRQVPRLDGTPRTTVEVVVDSMRVEFSAGSGEEGVQFNTQRLQGNEQKVRHREVLVPSTLVNRMVTFTLAPYGEILSTVSPSMQSVREQGADPSVDAFTKARIGEIASDDFLASVLLPWRGAAPLGRTVTMGEGVTVDDARIALDRVVFRAPVTSTVTTDADGVPHLRFSADLVHPVTTVITLPQFDEALPLVSATGTINGDLKLDPDGVVHSGWSMAQGTITAERGGSRVENIVKHEVYIEFMGLMPYIGTVSTK